MRKRGWFTFGVVVLLFGVLAVHLYRLTCGEAKPSSVNENCVSVTVAKSRGTIYDCNGEPFVNSEKSYFAALPPDETPLAQIRTVADPRVWENLRKILSDGKPASVQLSGPTVPKNGIKLFYLPIRYGKRVLAPHLIGYTESGRGVSGIELAYDDLLEQYSGKATASFAVSGNGTYLAGVDATITDTTDRSNGGVILTVDRKIQHIVEDTAGRSLKKGAVIVMDPYTGSIRALASFPTFQPNSIADSIAANDGALVNRALSLYDCGSVFKIITAAAALESGISVKKTFSCNGALSVEASVFHCHNRFGHQRIAMKEAFAQSCNLYFIQLAQHIGAAQMYKTAADFGVNRGIPLANELGSPAGILPDKSLLDASPVDLANFSFGQGYLMVSPLHVAQIVSAVVNDGIMPKPQLIAGVMDENGKTTDIEPEQGYRVVSESTAATLQSMMRAVVEEGTGGAAQSRSGNAAGKTGTAETGQINEDGSAVVQGWFAGYFPAENPKYVMVVLSENVEQSGIKPANVFCEISNKLLQNE